MYVTSVLFSIFGWTMDIVPWENMVAIILWTFDVRGGEWEWVRKRIWDSELKQIYIFILIKKLRVMPELNLFLAFSCLYFKICVDFSNFEKHCQIKAFDISVKINSKITTCILTYIFFLIQFSSQQCRSMGFKNQLLIKLQDINLKQFLHSLEFLKLFLMVKNWTIKYF